MKSLTNEQLKTIMYGKSGRSFKINAGPGTGKTFILVETAKEKRKEKGAYVAYNSAIVKEAKSKMPATVFSKTVHGWAFVVGAAFGNRFNQRVSGYSVSNYLGINHAFYRGVQNEEFDISPSAMGTLALETVSRYCQASDESLNADHIPWGNITVSSRAIRQEIAQHVLWYSKKLWALMSDTNGAFPTTHDVYLKLWALSNPKINRDYIMVDEFQDTNPVFLDVILKQTHAQLILVGDNDQSIYQWRGAVNAMKLVDLGLESSLTQSFRFGDVIANLANRVLINYKEVPGRLKGFDQISSRLAICDRPDAIISRTNAMLVGKIIEQLEMGRSVGMAGGVGQIQSLVTGIGELKAGKRTTMKDLSLFRTYEELKEYSESSLGGDLKPLIAHIEKYGAQQLNNILSQVGSYGVNGKGHAEDQKFDVILMTAHRAKGLEFGKVVLTNDFTKGDSPRYEEAEANLLFVAVTRAQNVLDITDCEAAQDALYNRVKKTEKKAPTQEESMVENRFVA
jgi:hypothetical protein